jgi:hypothetical protein
MKPGDHVTVPDDDRGECVFAGPTDPPEQEWIADPGVGGGGYFHAVGWVQYPDGTTKKWLYEKIRLAPTPPSA